MRARLLAPALATAIAVSLAGCGEPDAVAENPVPEAPAPEQAAPEIAEAPAEPFPVDGLSGAAASPVPSSVFEEGVAALGEVGGPTSDVFADAPFEPGVYEAGVYEAGDVMLTLEPDGDFTLELAGEGRSFAGEARVYGDMMTLSNVDAPPGSGGFPMTCRIAPAPAEGFALVADGTSCALLDGVVFTPSG